MSARDDRAHAILSELRGRTDEMVELLVQLARLESPTTVPQAQAPVQALLRERLEGLGYHVRHLSGRATGGHLFAVPERRAGGCPAQLLIGHSDTVWSEGTLRTMPVEVDDGFVRGPGTFDMKAGLVQGIFALDTLGRLGIAPAATPVFFVNSDEETGSPESRRWVRLIARHVARAFVIEPSLGPEGKLKTARKGIGRFTVRAHGKPAHAGLDPTGGASAIGELADVIRRLHALGDLERGRTVNVGVIRGGTRPNVIAAEAEGEVDVRVVTAEDGEEVERIIRGLEARTPGTRLEVTGGIQAPPLERTPRNRALWQAAREAGRRLGLDLDEALVGGGSDGNTTSRYTATLDGLGPVGDGAHAAHECVRIASMPERAALLAELLVSPLAEA